MIDEKYTQSPTEPTVRRWQRGYEIPVDVAKVTETGEDGTQRIFWRYLRVVTDSLNDVDVEAALTRAGMPERAGEALERANPRTRALEARVEAASALAEKASVTAREVSTAMRDAAPGRNVP